MTGLEQALVGYAPTGFDMLSDQHVWRTFASKQDWINKAGTWMHPGDVCFDADGVLLRKGSDFDGARYPVTIARPA
jgi:hypothetical protein